MMNRYESILSTKIRKGYHPVAFAEPSKSIPCLIDKKAWMKEWMVDDSMVTKTFTPEQEEFLKTYNKMLNERSNNNEYDKESNYSSKYTTGDEDLYHRELGYE